MLARCLSIREVAELGVMKSGIALSVALAGVVPVWGQSLTVEMMEKMGNNSLFTRWRPSSHFLAPAGWMNVRRFLLEMSMSISVEYTN